MSIVGYLTQEQASDDHYSLANQEARCRDYIKHRSWQLVKVLKDVGSGKSAERPNYQELLPAIREKRVDVVVVYRLDRLSRNVVDVYNALDAFNRTNVGFASVQEAFDTTTAMGRAMLGVAAGVVSGEPVPFLRQSMQLLVQKGNPLGIHSLEDLARPEVGTIAICSPNLTIGDAGEKALRSAGVWQKLSDEGKIIRLDQPAQAKEQVINKKADATFIYSQCSAPSWVEGDPERSVTGKAEVVMTVPEETYGGMRATAVVLKTVKDPALAQAFIDFLTTPEAQEAITKWGYGKLAEPAVAPQSK